jgi:hypothetical protein
MNVGVLARSSSVRKAYTLLPFDSLRQHKTQLILVRPALLRSAAARLSASLCTMVTGLFVTVPSSQQTVDE